VRDINYSISEGNMRNWTPQRPCLIEWLGEFITSQVIVEDHLCKLLFHPLKNKHNKCCSFN
jgi:hypothetical protein